MESETAIDDFDTENTLIMYQKSKRQSFGGRNLESSNSDHSANDSASRSLTFSSSASTFSRKDNTENTSASSDIPDPSTKARYTLKKRSRKEYVLHVQKNLDHYYKDRIKPVVNILKNYGRKKIKITIDNEPYMGVSYSDGRITLDYSLLASDKHSKLLFILTHEWGHRFLRHKVGLTGALSIQQEQEKQADFFSAYIIARYFKNTFDINALQQYMCVVLKEDKDSTHLVGPSRFAFFFKAFSFSQQNMSQFSPRQVRRYLQKMFPIEDKLLNIAEQQFNESFQIRLEKIPGTIARIYEDKVIRLHPKILKYPIDVIANILAHEIGHSVLGHLEPTHPYTTKTRRVDEKEADAFAAYIMSKYFTQLDCLEGFNRVLCQSKGIKKSPYHLSGQKRFDFYQNAYQYSNTFLKHRSVGHALAAIRDLAQNRISCKSGKVLPKLSFLCSSWSSKSDTSHRKKSFTI